MPTIKPFRSIKDHDVLNFYAFSGSIPAVKGTFVKIVGSGWRSTDDPVGMLGSVGSSVANTVSQRWGLPIPRVAMANSGDTALGLLLYDVREVDENTEALLFHPQKQDEMQCVLSGQAVPVATKGIFLYSGISGTPTAGAGAYLSDFGGLLAAPYTAGLSASLQVGVYLGAKDDNGVALVKLDI